MKIRFEVLKWQSANKLKNAKNVNFLFEIEYNLARVYLLGNWSYLVTPLNPAGNSLLTDHQELVQKWIKERYFPAGDEVGKLYIDHRKTIENLMTCKEGLKNSLYQCIYGTQLPSHLFAYEIEDLYEILKQRRLYDRFKLHFMVLFGDYIISRQEDTEWGWGLLRTWQNLNPLISLVLLPNKNTNSFYDLEDQLAKQHFRGVDHYMKAIRKVPQSQLKKLEEITRLMEPAHIQ